jgi:hypothetical protein
MPNRILRHWRKKREKHVTLVTSWLSVSRQMVQQAVARGRLITELLHLKPEISVKMNTVSSELVSES